MPVRRRLAAVGVVLLALVLAACTGTASDPSRSPTAPGSGSPLPPFGYVALGDSFTAAPGLPETDRSDGCLRSSQNYPSLVAGALRHDYEVTLADRSCIGADTTDLTRTQQFAATIVPPQLDALTPGTDLVTLSIGGNDFGIFLRLLTGCLSLGGGNAGGSPCRHATDPRGALLSTVVPRIRQRLVAAVEEIRRRAPEAQVLVVGYPQLAPASGECPDRMPVPSGDVGFVRSTNHALTDNLARAAHRTGTTYVDVWSASAGHDICSDDPWVNGQQAQPAGAIPFHPLPAGQQAIAGLVLDAVRG